MEMAPMKKEGSESTSRFNLQQKFGTLQIFSVETNSRWPMQGWSSGDEPSYELDEDLVAEECARGFALDQETRWPLQGWCKASKTNKTSEESTIFTKPAVQCRWPHGW